MTHPLIDYAPLTHTLPGGPPPMPPDDPYSIHGTATFSASGGGTAPKIAGLLITAGAALVVMKFAGFRFNVGVTN